MKLLSWIRTIKQNGLFKGLIKKNGLDQSKEFKGNFCCLRAQVLSEVQDIRTDSFAFYEPSHDLKPREADEELRFDHEDVFSGFLTIGTLGIEPETPRFTSVAEEDVTGAQKDIAKLLTKKLDKLLEATTGTLGRETETPRSTSVAEEDVTGAPEDIAKLLTKKLDKLFEEYLEDSSSKQVESWNAEGDRESVDVCPSQGNDRYLSSLEFTERSKEVEKKKGVLTIASPFKRRKTVEGECNSMERHGTRDLIKGVIEKLHMYSSKTIKDDNDDYLHKKKDITKNVQIFRRKVHPVLSARDDKEIDDRRSCANPCNLKDPPLSGRFLVSNSISEANKKREKWIKTDAEYLVLEF